MYTKLRLFALLLVLFFGCTAQPKTAVVNDDDSTTQIDRDTNERSVRVEVKAKTEMGTKQDSTFSVS